MDDYLAANRALWDRWTPLHARSAFYDVEGFRAGRSTLNAVEREEVGPVRGKRLLHLQCHFGLDTLSWAREGALVTGVDFSDEAVGLARSLADELAIPARFIASDVYALPDVLAETFDVVFTSYGVLAWLPDLPRWAGLVARYLAPGGLFYLVEFHPLADLVDERAERIVHPYFAAAPLRTEEHGSYAAPAADLVLPSFTWTHPLGRVVTALAGAGLRLEFLHEFSYTSYPCYPFLRESPPGSGLWKAPGERIPLQYSLRARR